MLEQVQPVELDEPIIDVLTEGWLHKVMVAFHQVDRLPGWMMGVLLVGVTAVTGWFWQQVGHDTPSSRTVSITMAGFTAVDMGILIALPRLRRSFGPWQSQWLPLAIPRVLAALVLGVAGLWLGTVTGIWLNVLVQSAALLALLWGAVVETGRLSLTELVIFTDRLPVNTKPVRVLHISDLHIERLSRREERVLELVRETEADVIVITGDYVNLSYNRDPETLRQVRHLLGQLSAPYGVFATLGSPPVDLRESVVPIFQGLPIALMRRSWVKVDMDNGRSLVLLGLDCTHHLPLDRQQLARLVAQAPDNAPQVLLYHSPELMPEAVTHGIDLYFCGHTHGGQVRLPIIGPLLTSSQLGRRYVMGLYKEGSTSLYVSRGIGLEGLSAPRVRFMAPPEMTLVTIRGKG